MFYLGFSLSHTHTHSADIVPLHSCDANVQSCHHFEAKGKKKNDHDDLWQIYQRRPFSLSLSLSAVDFYMYLGSKVFFSAVCGSAINASKLDLISKRLSLTPVVITPTCGQWSRTQVLEPRSRVESLARVRENTGSERVPCRTSHGLQPPVPRLGLVNCSTDILPSSAAQRKPLW